ncbi:amidohydrolase family protein [Microtetraspora sp. NBRC 16547]|uniref:amidohydrolase n=1 Tax=Microtetraspora sp. NBRC 16547 TaxID=3030993 RepID=UPI0025545B35|nr:amidohydrolase family protein [Microtetraspora sp. NBRC 16547]
MQRTPPGTEIVDLDGAVVLPGLIDAHTHVEFCALSRDWLDVRGLSPDETLVRVRHHLETGGAGSGGWIIAQGTFGQKLPNRSELDGISSEIPILVRESMHRLSANSAALSRAGMGRGYTSPTGTLVELGADGLPTGLVEEGYHLFPVPSPDRARLREMLREELRLSFARHGVTCVYELPATADGVRSYQDLSAARALPTRISMTLTVAPGLNAILGSVEQLADIGLMSGFGNDDLWFGGFKLFMDGDDTASFDSSHLSKTPSRWGISTWRYTDTLHALSVAHRSGVQVWIHAIGDLAQRLALDAIEEAGRVAGPGDRRTRLEHVANRWIDEDLVRRLRELGVVPVPTAGFIHADGGRGVYAYRTLLDAGLRPPGNSDTGGTQPFATNPWFGVAAMLERTNRNGHLVAPGQAVGIDEAIRTYTEFGAIAGFREDRLGALGVGMLGDCAVYADDPRRLEPAALRNLEAELTIVGGRVVWRREEPRWPLPPAA